MSFSTPSRSNKKRSSPYRHIVKSHPRESKLNRPFHVPAYVRGKGLPQRPEFKPGAYLTPEAVEKVFCYTCPDLNTKKCRPYGAWCPKQEDECNRSIKCVFSKTKHCNPTECPDNLSPERAQEEDAETDLKSDLAEGSHPVVSVRTNAGVGAEAEIASIYAQEIEVWSKSHGVHDISHVSTSEMDFLKKGVAEVRDRAQERVWSEISHDELQRLAKRMGYLNAANAVSQSENWVSGYLDVKNEFKE